MFVAIATLNTKFLNFVHHDYLDLTPTYFLFLIFCWPSYVISQTTTRAWSCMGSDGFNFIGRLVHFPNS